MNKINRIYIITVLSLIIILLNENIRFKGNNKHFNSFLKFEDNEISIIINMKNLTKNKHVLFYEIMKRLNSTKNYYFIKKIGKPLIADYNKLVENTSVKIVQSNFPDSNFLALVVSLYGQIVPELVLFIEGEELLNNSENYLMKWVYNSYKKIMNNRYDYIFGNSIVIKGKKIGCSLLLARSSIIEHLLYYTDSDTSHANPFIQLSLATKAKFCFIPFNYIKFSYFENAYKRFSLNMNCPSINDRNNPSLCIMLPNFKRDYSSSSFSAFSNQTYKPKFYIIIQNENKKQYNLSLIQKKVKEPVYHIWMQNWNSFFFLNLRLSSVLPCDFILKYDDDQWPIDNSIQHRLINIAKGKNVIIGLRGYLVEKSYCGYSPKNIKIVENSIVDHAAVPLLFRPGYIKLDARNKIYRLYGGEDISLSLNSRKLCNVTSKITKMRLKEMQNDGNNQRADKQIISAFKNEKEVKFNLFSNTYCYLIRSGYVPILWKEFKIPKKDYLNITINHKTFK